jgi:hypothetical protein
MSKIKYITMALVSILFLSHCSTMVRNKDEAKLDGIKNVAIVAFEVNQPSTAMKTRLIATPSEHAKDIYEEMRKNIQANLKWNAKDIDFLTRKKEYQASYDQTMKGFQNKVPVGENRSLFIVENIMDYSSARILGPNGRDALMESLGVDAIIAAQVYVDLKAFTVMGVGNRYPQARVSFQVYRKGESAPIWYDGNLEGEKSSKSVGATGFFDEKLLNEMAVESSRSAFRRI